MTMCLYVIAVLFVVNLYFFSLWHEAKSHAATMKSLHMGSLEAATTSWRAQVALISLVGEVKAALGVRDRVPDYELVDAVKGTLKIRERSFARQVLTLCRPAPILLESDSVSEAVDRVAESQRKLSEDLHKALDSIAEAAGVIAVSRETDVLRRAHSLATLIKLKRKSKK